MTNDSSGALQVVNVMILWMTRETNLVQVLDTEYDRWLIPLVLQAQVK